MPVVPFHDQLIRVCLQGRQVLRIRIAAARRQEFRRQVGNKYFGSIKPRHAVERIAAGWRERRDDLIRLIDVHAIQGLREVNPEMLRREPCQIFLDPASARNRPIGRVRCRILKPDLS